MTLSPDSASGERNPAANASDTRAFQAVDLDNFASVVSGLMDTPAPARARDGGPAMTQDDTVSILDVLEEMQRIIDRHLEKTAQQHSDR